MGEVPHTCSRCGAPGEASFGERTCHDWPRGMSWWEGFSCDHCSEAYEGDDGGPLPPEYRAIELRHGGLWGLRLCELTTSTLVALRKIAGLTIEEIRRVKDSKPETVITGTRAELESIALRLGREKVVAVIKPAHVAAPFDAAALWLRALGSR